MFKQQIVLKLIINQLLVGASEWNNLKMFLILFGALIFCGVIWYISKIQKIRSLNIPTHKLLFPYVGHGYLQIGLNDDGKRTLT